MGRGRRRGRLTAARRGGSGERDGERTPPPRPEPPPPSPPAAVSWLPSRRPWSPRRCRLRLLPSRLAPVLPLGIRGGLRPLLPTGVGRSGPAAGRTRTAAAAVEGGDRPEGAAISRTIQLDSMILVWYLLNIYFNIYNKLVLKAVPFPYTITTFQFASVKKYTEWLKESEKEWLFHDQIRVTSLHRQAKLQVWRPRMEELLLLLPAPEQKQEAVASRQGAPVVRWPPVRAFRRNLASPSTIIKPSLSSHDAAGAEGGSSRKGKGMMVKISMDGVPIGRKVDLSACGSYSALSAAVDHLFRGLRGGEEALLDGYTLLYEDDEGDQMLVGDMPWDMFIATARRLRVLRTSALNASSLRAGSRKRAAAGC